MPASRSALAPTYLALSVIGFIVALVPTTMEALDSGNILFWTQPTRTVTELFANKTSTAFALDALVAAVVTCIWVVVESRRVGIGSPWRFIVLILLFGLGGPFPLFLWFREKALARPS